MSGNFVVAMQTRTLTAERNETQALNVTQRRLTEPLHHFVLDVFFSAVARHHASMQTTLFTFHPSPVFSGRLLSPSEMGNACRCCRTESHFTLVVRRSIFFATIAVVT